MEYYKGEWVLRKTYVYTEEGWTLLYYVPVSNGEVDLTSSDINGKVKWEYGYTGEYQTFTAPYSGYYKVELWGAQGGNNGATGGLGAYTSGEIYLEANTALYIYVGGQGSKSIGGWNGGGNARGANGSAGGGGGATDVRLIPTTTLSDWGSSNFESLKSRIMVAAGGSGGATGSSYNDSGRAGGGLFGTVGTGNGSSLLTIGYGTQTLIGININYSSANGGFGYGGNANTGSYNGGGGGSGWYGGAGGHATSWSNAGASGSSYISGHKGCNSISEESLYNNIIHTGSAYHYSDKYFINTTMIDGYGYSWSYYKNGKTNMPTQDGTSTMTGNSGNGFAKVTLETVEIIEQNFFNESIVNNLNDWFFTYSNSYQQFLANKTGTYRIELWGAQGGNNGATGGLGSYVQGDITLKSGDILYVYVGGQGTNSIGGWNGGGNARGANGSAGGGGGATDVRTLKTTILSVWNESNSLKSRIMVAAGGSGGATGSSQNDSGRAGGGLFGTVGTGNGSSLLTIGYGTQTIGGFNTSYSSANGGFGYGGSANTGSYNGGGGGSGWYGGAGGHATSWSNAGASGSSYISGHEGCIAINSNGDALSSSATSIETSYSWTNYIFTNTNMIDGYGYNWTTQRQTLIKMPTTDLTSTMTGNTGNGFAKITYIEN